MAGGEVYFEFIQVGQQMRVSAIDADTGTEVVVVTPLVATRTQMQQLALAKLKRKLADSGAADAPSQPRPPSGKFA
ncbi:DUF6898 family protein [Devosia albogilva]|uniref:DUF6898 family protein n=1 Tax=Devosia albogilva TaxID=429726 RepID=A0ABW5QP77_9HYPH